MFLLVVNGSGSGITLQSITGNWVIKNKLKHNSAQGMKLTVYLSTNHIQQIWCSKIGLNAITRITSKIKERTIILSRIRSKINHHSSSKTGYRSYIGGSLFCMLRIIKKHSRIKVNTWSVGFNPCKIKVTDNGQIWIRMVVRCTKL
jgi:hypothetical protein